jgi:hypothetical protein
MEDSKIIISMIQSMLAPGLMISACGMLLLVMNNKYSLVVSRIRALNDEKRKISMKSGENNFKFEEEVRLQSLVTQIELLHFRVKLVRNAVLSYSIAVGLFVMTSLCIGLRFSLAVKQFEPLTMGFFAIGMLVVLTGVVYAAMETWQGYKIVSYEIKVHE